MTYASNKKLNPALSRMRRGGSISEILICSVDFAKSSTENGILHEECFSKLAAR